jgi:hypothetical protein
MTAGEAGVRLAPPATRRPPHPCHAPASLTASHRMEAGLEDTVLHICLSSVASLAPRAS